jgi:hypothetical protein
MPWFAHKDSKGGAVIVKKLGKGKTKVVGHSSSLSQAEASVRARYMSETSPEKMHKK